jgi:hypothetical protein
MSMPLCSGPRHAEFQWTELYCQWSQIMTSSNVLKNEVQNFTFYSQSLTYKTAPDHTHNTWHLVFHKKEFFIMFCSTMTSRCPIGWRSLETTVLLDTCRKTYYKKKITETHRRTSPIGHQVFGLVRHKTLKCHLLNFRTLMS